MYKKDVTGRKRNKNRKELKTIIQGIEVEASRLVYAVGRIKRFSYFEFIIRTIHRGWETKRVEES